MGHNFGGRSVPCLLWGRAPGKWVLLCPILVVRGARASYPGDAFAVVERSW